MVVYDDLYIHGLAAEDQLRGVDPRDICIISTDRPGSIIQNSIGIGNGLAIVAARAYGAGDDDQLKQTVAGSIVIGIIAALAVVGGIAFALMSGSGNDKDKVAVPSVVG